MDKKTILVSALALSGACAFGGGVEGLMVATVGYCRSTDTKMSETNVVAQKLCKCDFLLNKDFKKNAKVYLCLFSASWCGPCRIEMPRIAKTYAETLKNDPDIEIIQFSQDRNDDKARAWAREYGVEFPVVKPKGGNPLALHCSGIPHLFIVKADGTVVEDGHPMRLFTEEKLRKIKKEITAGGAEPQVCNSDSESEKTEVNTSTADPALALTGPYGIRMRPNPGCEKGAEYVLKRLKDVYLPAAVRYYGDPFGGKLPSRVYTIVVKRNDGTDGRKYTGPSWGSCSDGFNQFTVGLAKDSDKWEMDITLLASRVLTICGEDDGAALHLYVNHLIKGEVKGIDPLPGIKEDIRQGLAHAGDNSEKKGRLVVLCKIAPMWAVFEELREKHPTFILDYYNLKNSRYVEGKLTARLSQSQMVGLLGEVTGEDVFEICKKHGVKGIAPMPAGKVSVARLLQDCDFLLNKDFKRNAKVYLCLFSASWCPPCRAEMPRIAKAYAKTLKDDPDIELIHFSRDQNDEKAMAWAKEHNVKFPVVKPKSGNPLDLHSRGIPHLFIVKADGTLIEEGHPMRIFNEEKFREVKLGKVNPKTVSANHSTKGGGGLQAEVDGHTWTYSVKNGEATIVAKSDKYNHRCAVSPRPIGHVSIPPELGGVRVTSIGCRALSGCDELTSVTIPDSVVRIDFRAFSWCKKLMSVTIPSKVLRVEGGVFDGCSALTQINVAAGNPEYVSVGGILYTKDWKSLVACPGGLASVTIPNCVTSIGRNAFSDCKKLTSITIPNGVLSIGDYAFDYCNSLTDVTLGRGVKSIGSCAFRDCDGLVSIRIPKSVENIDHSAFIFCSGLKEFIVDPNNRKFTAVNGMLLSKDRSELLAGVDGDVIVPDGVKSIGLQAFCQYSELTSVRLPNSVTDIGGSSFFSCVALTSLTIPAKVKSIGRNAFEGCRSLTSVTMCGERPESPDDVFRSCGNLKSIHVPANAKSWKGMKEWQGIPLVFDLE